MKTLEIVECRRCTQQYYEGDGITLEDGDRIDTLVRTIPKCSACRQPQDRSGGGGKRSGRTRHM